MTRRLRLWLSRRHPRDAKYELFVDPYLEELKP